MKRVILSLPADLTFDQLAIPQQAAIANVFGQYVTPMPGTVAAAGWVLCDAVTSDAFDPAAMPLLGLDWPVIGLWQWDGVGEIVALQPLDAVAFLAHLPPTLILDAAEIAIDSLPATLHEPHRWSGWPAIIA